MSCRSTPLTSAVTSLARLVDSGLAPEQVLSLFHDLRHASEETLGADGDNGVLDRPTHRSFIADLSDTVRNETSLSESRRQSILRRLAAAEGQEPLRASEYLAMRELIRAVGPAGRHLTEHLGGNVDAFRAAYAEATPRQRQTTRLAAPREWRDRFVAAHPDLPHDRASLYAFWRLDEEGSPTATPAASPPPAEPVPDGPHPATSGIPPRRPRVRPARRAPAPPASPAAAPPVAPRTPSTDGRVRPPAVSVGDRTVCTRCGTVLGAHSAGHLCRTRAARNPFASLTPTEISVVAARLNQFPRSMQTLFNHMFRCPSCGQYRGQSAPHHCPREGRPGVCPHCGLLSVNADGLCARCRQHRLATAIVQPAPRADDTHLVPVPDGAEPEEIETRTINGQILPRAAVVRDRLAALAAEGAEPVVLIANRAGARRYLVTRDDDGWIAAIPEVGGRVETAENLLRVLNPGNEDALPSAVPVVTSSALASVFSDGHRERMLARHVDREFTAEEFADYRADALREVNAEAPLGSPIIPASVADALGGLGSRQEGGRPFGVELEFEFSRQAAERQLAIGQALHEAGLTSSARRSPYGNAEATEWCQWSYEYDRSVLSGGEVVSPIMFDEPGYWRQMLQACDCIVAAGGGPTRMAGSHVNVGIGDYGRDPEPYRNLVSLVNRYEDLLYRLATDPRQRTHRTHSQAERMYCGPMPSLPADAGISSFVGVSREPLPFRNHDISVNFGGANGSHDARVEFRMWDATLDPGTIQAQVAASIGLVSAAARGVNGGRVRVAYGHHHETGADGDAMFREFARIVSGDEAVRKLLTRLYVANRWQPRPVAISLRPAGDAGRWVPLPEDGFAGSRSSAGAYA